MFSFWVKLLEVLIKSSTAYSHIRPYPRNNVILLYLNKNRIVEWSGVYGLYGNS